MIQNNDNKHILDALIENHGEIDGTTIFNNLENMYYEPSQSDELYDPINDQYYNKSGQILRNPDEYNDNFEGYTPFGDE